jgi:hypothetical protein
VEIQCPDHCGYLTSSRQHPAAIVRRRQEQDVGRLLPTIRHLTERQYQLFFVFHSLIARHTPEGLARLVDADVAEACAAMAATLETAARGVIYEHTPQARPAQGLASEMTTLLAQLRDQGATVHDREAAIVLRAIEQGARAATASGEGETAYLDLMGRLLDATGAPARRPDTRPASSLILP